MSEPIVKILPLSALLRALEDVGYSRGGRPTRIVACEMQISRWASDLPMSRYVSDVPIVVNIMGVPVIAGPDAPPELIWAIPVTDGQNAGGY